MSTAPLRIPARCSLGLVLLGLGCAPSAPPREPEVILTTEAVDRKVGEREAQKVGGAMGLLDDPVLTRYVSEVGQRLTRHAPRRESAYEFQIVDEDVPNAFALPGGFIYVSRGLLVLSNSEDELANVLAHEIVHVAARHAAARQAVIRSTPGFNPWFALGAIASYSRDQERSADRMGQKIAGAAGYNPQGLANFLKDLEFTERLRLGTSRLPGFLDTHPATAERVAAAGGRARTIPFEPAPGIARDRADYLQRLDGLVTGTAGSEGGFQGDRFLHPDLDFTIVFPPGWETRNTRQAVGAIAPRGDAKIFLELQAEGNDPERAAAHYLGQVSPQELSVRNAQPLELAGFAAYRVQGRARTPGGPISVHLTWIARRGLVFRLTGMARGPNSQGYQSLFTNVSRSFRLLPPYLRRSFRETRLRIVSARAGETLKQLSERTENEWDLQETAVVNDLFASSILEEGQLVKIAVSEEYRSASQPE